MTETIRQRRLGKNLSISTGKKSNKTTKSSNQTTNSSNQTTNSSNQITNSSNQTTNSSNQTTNSSNQTTNSSNQTTNSSNKITKSSNQTTNSSNQITNSSNQTTNSSNKTTKSSNQTTELSNQTTNSSNQTTESYKHIKELIGNISKNISKKTFNTPFTLNKLKESRRKVNSGIRKIGHTNVISAVDIFTYKYKHKNNSKSKIIKIYNYSSEDEKTESRIINEIKYQNHAFDISTYCNFKVPEILEYNKINIDETEFIKFQYNTIFYIIMEYIEFPTLKKFLFENKDIEQCKTIEEKLNKVIECMEINNLYHNDLHKNNILIDNTNDKLDIYIIDYGEASEENIGKSWKKNYSLCKENISRQSPPSNPPTIPGKFNVEIKVSENNNLNKVPVYNTKNKPDNLSKVPASTNKTKPRKQSPPSNPPTIPEEFNVEIKVSKNTNFNKVPVYNTKIKPDNPSKVPASTNITKPRRRIRDAFLTEYFQKKYFQTKNISKQKIFPNK
jgi:hypothetical protein